MIRSLYVVPSKETQPRDQKWLLVFWIFFFFNLFRKWHKRKCILSKWLKSFFLSAFLSIFLMDCSCYSTYFSVSFLSLSLKVFQKPLVHGLNVLLQMLREHHELLYQGWPDQAVGAGATDLEDTFHLTPPRRTSWFPMEGGSWSQQRNAVLLVVSQLS